MGLNIQLAFEGQACTEMEHTLPKLNVIKGLLLWFKEIPR